MRPTLPSPFARDLAILGGFLIVAAGCGKEPPPVAPGTPIAADPDVTLRSMQEECDGLIVALTTLKACPNLEDEEKDDLAAQIEYANLTFAAGRKANPDADAQRAIAFNCYRARVSSEAAIVRCAAGPRPKDSWNERR